MNTPDDVPSEMGSEAASGSNSVEHEKKTRSGRGGGNRRKSSKPKGGGAPKNDEVNILRKEIEEMKFYQELEQTEYQEMKEKMHTYEKQMKDLGKRKTKDDTNRRGTTHSVAASKALHKIEEESEFASSNVDTIDLIASVSPKSSRKMSENDKILQKKLKKRDTQIQQLKSKLSEKVTSSKESSGKLKSLAKEYEKRLIRMESLKDEEIEEIKDHYKVMMETLAKQLQKSSTRLNDEAEKNANIRSMMEEMRNDMTKREVELEKKIKNQQVSIKKSETKLTRSEAKLDRSGSKYSSLKNELDAALKSNSDYSTKVDELEEKLAKTKEELEEKLTKTNDMYSDKIEEMEEKFNLDLRELEETHDRDNRNLQNSVEEEISAMTAKLVDAEKYIEKEANEHDQTAAKLEETKEQLQEKEEEIETLTDRTQELEETLNKTREELQEEINRLDAQVGAKNTTHDKQVTDLAKESMNMIKELKTANDKLFQAEKELRLLNDDKIKKNKNLKKRVLEINDLQFRLDSINEVHLKEIKLRDIEYVKAKKKWNMNEQRLQKEMEELKDAQEKYEALQETESGNIVFERAVEDQKRMDSQKLLIDQLKSDKAHLQMVVASLEGKANKEILVLEKELTKMKRLQLTTAYDRKLERKIEHQQVEEMRSYEDSLHQHHTDDESLVSQRRDEEPEERGSGSSKEDKFAVEIESSEISSTESATVPVHHVKPVAKVVEPKRGITAQRSYRNYVRNRKFSKKNVTVGNE